MAYASQHPTLDNYPAEENPSRQIEVNAAVSQAAPMGSIRRCPWCGFYRVKRINRKRQTYQCLSCGKSFKENSSKRRFVTKEEREQAQRQWDREGRMRIKARRQRLLESLGGRCQVCGSTRFLELQHLTYKNGNPYKENNHTTASRRIVREAEKDPNNFALLCHRCHETATFLTRAQLILLAKYVTQSEPWGVMQHAER